MTVRRIHVMYGKLEGTEGKFARDPSGYLSIEKGIYRQYGLAVSWDHVQGTEERYRRLGVGEAHISMVVGRAALAHYLASGRTRILGCAMNRCPYFLIVGAGTHKLSDLKGKSVACREAQARNAPLSEVFQRMARLELGKDLALVLPESDRRAFELLVSRQVEAALLPRPYGLLAEDKGLQRIEAWPDVVDDPLPITIETSEALALEMQDAFAAFLTAHQQGIRYFKSHRDEAIVSLMGQFGHSAALAARTFEDYLIWLDDRLTVDAAQVSKLIAQVAPQARGRIDHVTSDWIVPGALRS